MANKVPKTDTWKRSLLITSLTKAGWNFWFKEEGQLWGSYEPFKIHLRSWLWILFEDLPAGLLEIKRDIYDRRQTQKIKRAIIKVMARRAKNECLG